MTVRNLDLSRKPPKLLQLKHLHLTYAVKRGTNREIRASFDREDGASDGYAEWFVGMGAHHKPARRAGCFLRGLTGSDRMWRELVTWSHRGNRARSKTAVMGGWATAEQNVAD